MKRKILTAVLWSLLALCLASTAFLAISIYQITRPLSDEELVQKYFDPKYPGFENIQIIQTSGNPRSGRRVLNLQVSLETGAQAESCQAQLTYASGDPSFLGVEWASLDCVLQSQLVFFARTVLAYPGGPTCHRQEVAEVLAYWLRAGRIRDERILDSDLRTQAKGLQAVENPLPSTVRLSDRSRLEIHDLNPEISNVKKARQIILRCDGKIDEYRAVDNAAITTLVGDVGVGDVYLVPPLVTDP